MPRIDGWQAAASAIQGFRGGYNDRKKLDLERKRYEQKYAEAEIEAKRKEAQREVQRKALSSIGQRASKDIRQNFNAYRKSGKEMPPERIEYFQKQMSLFKDDFALKRDSGKFSNKELTEYANEWEVGIKHELWASEYKDINDELAKMDRSGKYDSKIIKQIRDSLDDPKEIGAPNAYWRTIRGYKEAAASARTEIELSQVKEGVAAEILDKYRTKENYENIHRWIRSNQDELSTEELELGALNISKGRKPLGEPEEEKDWLDKAVDGIGGMFSGWSDRPGYAGANPGDKKAKLDAAADKARR